MNALARVPVILCVIALYSSALAQRKCQDAAAEPHHRVIFESKDVRIFQLELGRLQTTTPYCYGGAVVTIITTETRSTRTNTGFTGITHDWFPGETRFIVTPVERSVRNESMFAHREIIVESRRKVEYNLLRNTSDSDEFPAVLDSNQPTWSVDFTRGGLSAKKTQLAPDDHTAVSTLDHLLIALDDIKLSTNSPKKKDIVLSRGESAVLNGGATFALTNRSNTRGRFILVEF